MPDKRLHQPSRRKKYMSEEKRARIQQATRELHAKGVYPSVAEVKATMGRPTNYSFNSMESAARREVMIELGIRPRKN